MNTVPRGIGLDGRISVALARRVSTGTSYGFLNDPNLTNLRPPVVLWPSIELNVVTAILSVILGWIGFALIFQAIGRQTN
ncbi:hypothetical protein SD80_029515 [Scytonema tolypothrichoides VB-61278]|nr:hypothetical protein SD80_029515 [Scytonema tolypothrichoides VB-61278]